MSYNLYVVFTDNDYWDGDFEAENVTVQSADGVIKVAGMGHPDKVFMFPADKVFAVELTELDE